MPIPKQHLQEQLSYAYVQAIAAMASAHYDRLPNPEYGTDVRLTRVVTLEDGSRATSGFPLACSVKSTTNWHENNDHIVYDLEVLDYNKLVSRDTSDAILVLLCQPQNESDWLTFSLDSLTLKKCCYWYHILQGERSQNSRTTRIFIPTINTFDPESLRSMLETLHTNRGSLR